MSYLQALLGLGQGASSMSQGGAVSSPVIQPVVPGVTSAVQAITAPPAASTSLAPVASVQPGTTGVTIGGITSPSNTPFGMNMGTAGLALGGLQTLAGIYSAFQGQELAQDTFDFQKRVAQANMTNQTQSYNTTLADRIRARAIGENGHNGGMDRGDVRGYLQKNQLKPTFLG